MIYSRPFQNVCDNLAEIINEIFFTIASCSLIYLNTEKNWEGSNTSIYIYLLISNNMIVASLVLGNLFRNLVLKCINKFSKSENKQPQVQPKVPKKPEVIVNPAGVDNSVSPQQKLDSVSISNSRISSHQMMRPQNEMGGIKLTHKDIVIKKLSKNSPKKPVELEKF